MSISARQQQLKREASIRRLRAKRASQTPEDKAEHAARCLKDYHYYATHDPEFRERCAKRRREARRITAICRALEQASEYL